MSHCLVQGRLPSLTHKLFGCQRRREAADRQELMERAEMGRQIKSEMDEEAAVLGHISSSKRMLTEMFDTGTSILSSMGANRERIKVGADMCSARSGLTCGACSGGHLPPGPS
jgi:hypothetical protein